MFCKNIKIINKDGIHCRPSSIIMQKVQEYPDCLFIIESSKGEIDLSSILGLISLGLECGDSVSIKVEGPDEEKVCEEIAEIFSTNFGFKS